MAHANSNGLAATWNPDLATACGAVIGQEAKRRGKNIMLGPSRNIQRMPLCGRNFEYKIMVGSSSRDLPLNGKFKPAETTVEK